MTSVTRRVVAIAFAATALVLTSVIPAFAAAPPNDAFTSATNVSSIPYVNELDATDATLEGSEPQPTVSGCDSTDASTWYRVTLQRATYLRADTFESGGADLSIWTGAWPALDLVACGGDANEDASDARVTWRAKAGVTYHVRVGGTRVHQVLHIRKVPAPSNDDWAKARSVTALPAVFTTSLINATREPNEPVPACATSGPSLWYRVRLPRTRTVVVDTLMSGFDTFIQVTRGATLAGQTVRTCGDDIPNAANGVQSRIAFTALAGRTYFVQVGGYNSQNDELAVRFRAVTPPSNDAFAKAATLPQNGRLVERRTIGATIQAGEPLGACASQYTGSTVWYRFTASATASYHLVSHGSDYSTTLTAFSGGPGMGSLTSLGCEQDGDLDFAATAGSTYWIQVGGFDAQNGDLHLRLSHP